MKRRPRTTREQRATRRLRVGPLAALLLKDRTRKLYDLSLSVFGMWLETWELAWPSNEADLDDLVVKFIQTAWQEGETKALCDNLVSSFKDYNLSKCLPFSRRYLATWKANEITTRCLPVSFDIVKAMVGLCLHWKWLDMAVSIYLSYKALLRMCELVCITYGDFVIAENHQSFILALYEGKTVTLHGKIENVKVSDPSLAALLSLLQNQRAKGDRVFPGQAPSFRRHLDSLVQALQLENELITPHSMRRGGATDHFRLHGNLHATTVMGSWQSVKTCRLYIDQAIADRADMNVKTTKLFQKARNVFDDFFL